MIILIAGATGVGKTTLAFEILRRFPTHVINSSDIREALRTIVTKDVTPELFLSTYRLNNLITQNTLQVLFERQAQLIINAIGSILNRQQRSNIIYVVEGVHILPSILKALSSKPSLILLLRQPSADEHWERLVHRAKNVKSKPVSKYEGGFNNIREIGSIIERTWLSVDPKEVQIEAVNIIDEGVEIAKRKLELMNFSSRIER